MRKILFCFLLVLIFALPSAFAESAEITRYPQLIHPGKAERIGFSVPSEGVARLEALNARGDTVTVIRAEMDAFPGVNNLTWDGCGTDGYPLPPGDYVLRLTFGEETDEKAFQAGDECPQILYLRADKVLENGRDWTLAVTVSMQSVLTVRAQDAAGQWYDILCDAAEPGENVYLWDGETPNGRLPYGSYRLELTLTDAEGVSGSPEQIALTVVERLTPSPVPSATPTPTPAIVIPSQAVGRTDETSYWTLPMGVMDEQAIWDVMMQPITVIDGKQTEVYRLRKTPDDAQTKDNVVGEITYASQGVHILDTRDDGWTLVEAYNSSYGPKCGSRPGFGVTDDLIRGYVKTSLLKVITPREDYALLIDKLNQTLYIFSEGHVIGELLVSTGKNNKEQSWNETPAGEFLMVSRMGGFPAGNLYCPYGMRINGGCAIHEVPYKGTEDTPPANRDYSMTKVFLGQKASHGCVRVQKTANDQGQNMLWLWNHIKVNTKVLIWDDTGRYIPYPDPNTPVYYNPVGGKYFHQDQNCKSVSTRYLPLTEITYAELCDSHANLTPCKTCADLMSKAEIDRMNQENNP